MHKFMKAILTITCFALTLTPAFSSDDDTGGGVDLSSLLGGGNQQSQPSISDLLRQQVPGNPLSETTDSLIQLFDTGGKFSFEWIGSQKTLSAGIEYAPAQKSYPSMASFSSIEDSLSSFICTALQNHFFKEGEFSEQERQKREKDVSIKNTSLKQLLSNPKILQFYRDYPTLFGNGGLDQFVKDNLSGAFTASSDYLEEESKLDQALLQYVLDASDPIIFTFAFPRTDGILKNKKSSQEKVFGIESRNFVIDMMHQGTITITLATKAKDDSPNFGNRQITSDTGLSDVITTFEQEVKETLGLFITAAAMKSGVGSRPAMYQ